MLFWHYNEHTDKMYSWIITRQRLLTLMITECFNRCFFSKGNSRIYICMTCKTLSGQNVPCGTCSAMPQPCVFRSTVQDKGNKILAAAVSSAHIQTPTDVMLSAMPQQVAINASQSKTVNRLIVMQGPGGATRQVTV